MVEDEKKEENLQKCSTTCDICSHFILYDFLDPKINNLSTFYNEKVLEHKYAVNKKRKVRKKLKLTLKKEDRSWKVKNCAR